MIFIACQYVLTYKKNKLQDCYSIYVLTMNDVSAGAGVTGFNHLYSNELSNELSCRVQTASCRLQGCKNRPALFPGRMSYNVTKPGLVCVLYLSML